MNLKIEEFFKNSINSRSPSDNNKKTAGYSCSYVPEELITAAGFIPYRIFGNKESNLADKYFPINYCPYVKAVWEEIHHNDTLSSLILATSCDGIRRLKDYVSYYEKELPVFMLDIPRKSDKNSVEFFADNLRKLWLFLCEIGNTDPEETERIKTSLSLMRRKRALLKELTELYENDRNNAVGNKDYFKIINISLNSRADIFNDELNEYIRKIKFSGDSNGIGNNGSASSLKIMIMGNYLNDDNFWSVFESLDVKLLSSDLCITYRYFDIEETGNPDGIMSEENDIFSNMACSYISKPACFRMAGITDKINRMRTKIFDNNIRGVIFASLKFCDNTLYSFPAVKEELGRIKIPSIFLDIEYGKSSYGQLKTRIEAFIEMLSLYN